MLMRLGKRSLRDRGSRRGGGRTARSALPRSDATTQGLRARRRRVRGGLARYTEGGAYPGRLTAGQAGRHATCRQRRTASAFERCHKNCSRARPLRRSAPSASTLLTLGKIRRHFCDPHPSTQAPVRFRRALARAGVRRAPQGTGGVEGFGEAHRGAGCWDRSVAGVAAGVAAVGCRGRQTDWVRGRAPALRGTGHRGTGRGAVRSAERSRSTAFELLRMGPLPEHSSG